jgi:hypothetical protein
MEWEQLLLWFGFQERGSSGEGKEMVSVWEKKMMVEPAAKLEACAGG